MAKVFRRKLQDGTQRKEYSLRWRENGEDRRLDTDLTSKAEANDLLAEKLSALRRRKAGLDPLPVHCKLTFWELCDWWLVNWCPAASLDVLRPQLDKHIHRTQLGGVLAKDVSTEDLDDYFKAMVSAGAAGSTVNKLRGILISIFNKAAKKKLLVIRNPASDTDRFRETDPDVFILKVGYVQALLKQLSDEWRPVFACALYLGLRKGELFGLRRECVDLEAGLLTIKWSYATPWTKGEKLTPKPAVVLPIPRDLVPYLKKALARTFEGSPSPWVFPSLEGKMLTKESDPHEVLATALGKIGLVAGYLHTCRRCGPPRRKSRAAVPPVNPFAGNKPYEVTLTDDKPRRCPQCTMKLWCSVVPRHMKFHWLRHTTATLLTKAGVPEDHVRRICRHADVKMTRRYTHMDAEDLRESVNKVLPMVRPEAPPSEPEKSGAKLAHVPEATK